MANLRSILSACFGFQPTMPAWNLPPFYLAAKSPVRVKMIFADLVENQNHTEKLWRKLSGQRGQNRSRRNFCRSVDVFTLRRSEVRSQDARHTGSTECGVIYTGGKGKVAEHVGFSQNYISVMRWSLTCG